MNVNFNILNQKGAPAVYEDSLINRPAPSFRGRLFVDTDQPTSTGIYRDTGTSWQQIAGGGGGGVNIYNSDGTLTGARNVNCANQNLQFSNAENFFIRSTNVQFNFRPFGLDRIFTSAFNQIKGISLAFDQSKYSIGETGGANNKTFFEIDDNNQIIKTQNQGNDIGLKLDFLNDSYTLGDPLSFTGAKYFTIDNLNGIIATGDNVGVNGFKLDLNNSINQFGFISTTNSTQIVIDDTNQIIKTSNQGNDIGLKLDFANNQYYLGNNFFGNNDFLGFGADCNSGLFSIGDLNNIWSYTYFQIDSNNGLIKTSNLGNDIGLKLDFANKEYSFGEFTTNNRTNFTINDNNQTILTFNNNLANGINLNFPAAQRRFWFGDYAVNFCYLRVDSTTTNQSIAGYSNGISDNGFVCDFINKIYNFGDLQNNGGSIRFNQFNCTLNYNTTLQINGTSIITATASGNSGQHLKVKINNVDYVIKLENP